MTSWWHAPYLDSQDVDKRDVRELFAVTDEDAFRAFNPTRQYEPPAGANLQGSPNCDEEDTHSIVLDLDCPHEYRPSATPGHGHLIIPARLSKKQYTYLLDILHECGVISDGYRAHAERRDQATFVRAPGVLKPADAAGS